MDQIWKVRDSTPYPPPPPPKLLNIGVCVFPFPSILILVFSFQNDSTCLVHITFSLYIPYNFHLMFPSIFFFLKLTRKKSKLNTNQLLFQKIMALSTAITRYTKAFFTMMSNTHITNLSSILSWQNNNTQMIKSFLKIY